MSEHEDRRGQDRSDLDRAAERLAERLAEPVIGAPDVVVAPDGVPAPEGIAIAPEPAVGGDESLQAIPAGGTDALPSTETEHPGDAPAGADADRVIHDAAVLSVAGRRLDVRDAVIGSLAARDVEAHDTLVVVGTVGTLRGDARVLFDVPSAIAFGAALGAVLALLGRVLGGGKGRERR
mgnify:CR=1 FL=1